MSDDAQNVFFNHNTKCLQVVQKKAMIEQR